MPIYEYRCLKCGHQFEKFQNITDDAVSHCEKCGERVTRLFHPVAIHFKGSGFYTTDYGKKAAARDKPEPKQEKKKKDKKSNKKAPVGKSD